jgi:hypothetical protein
VVSMVMADVVREIRCGNNFGILARARLCAAIWRSLLRSGVAGRDVNGDPIPDNPWGIPLLGYGYGTKNVPMGMDMGQNLHPLGKRV